jgi:hypothetical protein
MSDTVDTTHEPEGAYVEAIGTVLWCNGCHGRNPGMWASSVSESIHQRAGSSLFPPENLVTTVPRF